MESLQAGRRHPRRSLAGLLLCGAFACAPTGTAAPSQLAVPDPEPRPAPAAQTAGQSVAGQSPSTPDPPPAASTAPQFDDNLDEDIAEITASLASSGPETSRSPQTATANPSPTSTARSRPPILYRVSPKGLVIEVDGLHFRPQASAHRHRNGSYRLQLVLEAESFDGRAYQVQKGQEGPMSIAGTVTNRDGSKTRFGDQRRPGDPGEVVYGDNVSFRQLWPGQGQPSLRAGQRVNLEVGLWGISAEGERERPVRRLFTLEFEGQGGATPAIEPPALDWGQ